MPLWSPLRAASPLFCRVGLWVRLCGCGVDGIEAGFEMVPLLLELPALLLLLLLIRCKEMWWGMCGRGMIEACRRRWMGGREAEDRSSSCAQLNFLGMEGSSSPLRQRDTVSHPSSVSAAWCLFPALRAPAGSTAAFTNLGPSNMPSSTQGSVGVREVELGSKKSRLPRHSLTPS